MGLADLIDWWVFKRTCRQLTDWRRRVEQAGLTVAVNLSSNAFLRSDLAQRVKSELERLELEPAALHVEIVEAGIMKNVERSRSTLNDLSGLGLRMSLDDFGTGYSSLSHLREFPLDAVKIDRTFISRVTEREKDLEIVRAIVELGHNLGLEVVAEGIETKEQLQVVRYLGCDYGQGYHFSPPMDAAEFFECISVGPTW